MVRLAETARDLEQAYAVRHQVFVQEQRVPEDLERDAHDLEALHWLACDSQNRAIGTARLVRLAELQGKVGRVALLPEWRGQGLGRRLMEAIHDWAREQGLRGLVLDAQVTVLSFYLKLGYQPRGEVFEECGILHRRMVRWPV